MDLLRARMLSQQVGGRSEMNPHLADRYKRLGLRCCSQRGWPTIGNLIGVRRRLLLESTSRHGTGLEVESTGYSSGNGSELGLNTLKGIHVGGRIPMCKSALV